MQKFFLFLLCVSAGCATTNPWRDVRTPTKGSPTAVGGYTAGCLNGAQSLYASGSGYEVMRLSRRRFYGHPKLILFLSTLGKQVHNKKLGTLLVGDLSQPRGGPFLFKKEASHASHQSGLDVDIWFQLWPLKSLPPTLDERENLDAAPVTQDSATGLNLQVWSTPMERVLKLAAEHPDVERIFVTPAVKYELCRKYKNATWLHVLRPWWGHKEHFHVRLKCPADSPCLMQESVPEGPGCDDTLNWWFSEEATAQAKERATHPETPKMPELPPACLDILKQ